MRILRIIEQEFVQALATLVLSTFLVFAIAFYATSDAQKQERMNIEPDEWLITAYGNWVTTAWTGNILGSGKIAPALVNTLILVTFALVSSVVVGVALALVLQEYDGHPLASIVERTGYLSGSVPVFLIALGLVIFMRERFPDAFFFDPLASPIAKLPPFVIAATVLSFGSGVLGELVRVFKFEIERIRSEQFVQAARARGASVWQHVAIALVVPVSSALTGKIPYFIGAAIIVERPFQIGGIGGQLLHDADIANIPRLMITVSIVVAFIILARVINSLVVATIDPRVK